MLASLLVVVGLSLHGQADPPMKRKTFDELWDELPGPAPGRSGLDLLRGCRVALDAAKAEDLRAALSGVHCMGYVEGIADAHAVLVALVPDARQWCEPSTGLQTEQRVMVVVKHLEGRPESLHNPARTEVVIAHRAAFPCKAWRDEATPANPPPTAGERKL